MGCWLKVFGVFRRGEKGINENRDIEETRMKYEMSNSYVGNIILDSVIKAHRLQYCARIERYGKTCLALHDMT